ncbi:NB-ARC domain [Musa troglodytarum]|uniref:NB-ARC domain n=1 Tax=Musa troglodytarum TaxID=320322 RepID=A0A9E7HVU0_9LILI|nr:NB-ARC domain [Musa troglodytarum]
MSLMELVVEGYNGPRLPRWLGDPSFSNLATIRLELCNDKCILLPSLGQLVSLKHLSIGGMQRLQRVDREFWGGGMVVGKGFPALETLEFTEMPEWKEWCGEDGDFPHLRKLTICVCPKLCTFDCLLFPSLVKLKIYDCGELTSIPMCPSLSSLLLWGKCNLEIWFPSLNVPKLHHLAVSSSQGLRTLHVRQNVPALRTLRVDNCPNLLEATGLHHLASLLSLQISNCPLLEATGLHHLASLVSLQISNCPRFYIKEKLPSHVQVLLYPSGRMQKKSISVSRGGVTSSAATRATWTLSVPGGHSFVAPSSSVIGRFVGLAFALTLRASRSEPTVASPIADLPEKISVITDEPVKKHGKLAYSSKQKQLSMSCTLEFDGAPAGKASHGGAGAILRTEDGSVFSGVNSIDMIDHPAVGEVREESS